MKDSVILKEARTAIDKGWNTFICDAIKRVCTDQRQARRLTAWVSSMIYPWATYDSWLRHTHSEYSYVKWNTAKQGRLDWLDWMIYTLESAGL